MRFLTKPIEKSLREQIFKVMVALTAIFILIQCVFFLVLKSTFEAESLCLKEQIHSSERKKINQKLDQLLEK